jgi:hypothetical protein
MEEYISSHMRTMWTVACGAVVYAGGEDDGKISFGRLMGHGLADGGTVER